MFDAERLVVTSNPLKDHEAIFALTNLGELDLTHTAATKHQKFLYCSFS